MHEEHVKFMLWSQLWTMNAKNKYMYIETQVNGPPVAIDGWYWARPMLIQNPKRQQQIIHDTQIGYRPPVSISVKPKDERRLEENRPIKAGTGVGYVLEELRIPSLMFRAFFPPPKTPMSQCPGLMRFKWDWKRDKNLISLQICLCCLIHANHAERKCRARGSARHSSNAWLVVKKNSWPC